MMEWQNFQANVANLICTKSTELEAMVQVCAGFKTNHVSITNFRMKSSVLPL